MGFLISRSLAVLLQSGRLWSWSRAVVAADNAAVVNGEAWLRGLVYVAKLKEDIEYGSEVDTNSHACNRIADHMVKR